MQSMNNPKRGDIVRVRLSPVEGSKKFGQRPALVISPDLINEHSPVILIAAITSKKVNRIYPFEVGVRPPDGGLSLPSKILLMHTRSIDKRRLIGFYGRVTDETMAKVDEALKIVTGLTHI